MLIRQSHNKLIRPTETKLSSQLKAAEVAGITFSDSAPVPKFLNPCLGSKFFKSENPTPVQSPATIDATAIQQCLFCTEAMTFVKTVQSPVTAKNKRDSGSGPVFSEMLDFCSKNKRRILLESTTDPWSPMLGSIPHKQSAKWGTTIHWANILEMLIISLFFWKRFCLPGYLKLMLTVVRRISKPKWMPLDTYRPSTLISCISWRSGDVITNIGVRPSLTTNFNRWRHQPGSWGGRIVH